MAKRRASASSAAIGNPDDAIRDAILRHLFQAHKAARSPAKAAVGIRDLHSALREAHGYKQQEVGSNLDYLVQKGWVTEVKIARSFTTKRGTTQNSEQTRYKISDIGIDKLQQASLFQKAPVTAGINITNIHGVTVIGDGNVVNTEFTDLSRILNQLKADVQAVSSLDDQQKLATVADIETLQAQLQKQEPNKSIVGLLWNAIEKTCRVGGLITAVEKVGDLISPLVE